MALTDRSTLTCNARTSLLDWKSCHIFCPFPFIRRTRKDRPPHSTAQVFFKTCHVQCVFQPHCLFSLFVEILNATTRMQEYAYVFVCTAFMHEWHVFLLLILICMMSAYFTARVKAFSLMFCVSQWLYSTQEALAARGHCYSWTRCFHCLCIILGIWIAIPLWLWICWPNEPTWLIDTGDYQRSHSSFPVVNKHWIFYPHNVCLLMDHFNSVGGGKKIHTSCQHVPGNARSPSHASNLHKKGARPANNFKQKKELWLPFRFLKELVRL